MNYIRHIDLDVNATSSATIVKAKQGDDSLRYINVTLLQDGVQFIPESGATAIFRLEKPDGHAVVNDAIIESDGTITVQVTAQCTAVCGRSKADILISLGDGTISTAVFVLEIEKSPDVSIQIASSNEFGVINRLIESIDDLVGVPFEIRDLTLIGSEWSNTEPYTQQVTISDYDVTNKTKVDLSCNAATANTLAASGVTRVYIENDSGVLTAYSIPSKPSVTISVQAAIREVK